MTLLSDWYKEEKCLNGAGRIAGIVDNLYCTPIKEMFPEKQYCESLWEGDLLKEFVISENINAGAISDTGMMKNGVDEYNSYYMENVC